MTPELREQLSNAQGKTFDIFVAALEAKYDENAGVDTSGLRLTDGTLSGPALVTEGTGESYQYEVEIGRKGGITLRRFAYMNSNGEIDEQRWTGKHYRPRGLDRVLNTKAYRWTKTETEAAAAE